MGKIDIDYQKLHDAFFKWQIKPKLTIHGDLYYEVRWCYLIMSVCFSWWHFLKKKNNTLLLFQGKEFETRLKEKKPGDLSDELRVALGMPTGPVSASSCIAFWAACSKQPLYEIAGVFHAHGVYVIFF